MSKSGDMWEKAFRWIENTIGGTIINKVRQGRGRPAWFLEVEVNGKEIPLYWRGYRGDLPGGQPGIYAHYPIEREAKILRIMEDEGIPVPHVYGFCQDPVGILMERAPGSPDFHHIADAQERDSVARHFMESLALVHRISPEVFEGIGMARPANGKEQALDDISHWEEVHRRTVNQPAPLIEFTLKWLHGNVPEKMGKTVLVHGDTGPGNFLSQDGRVTAILDWEFAHLGDPMCDLALIRARDLCYPFGDLRERFQMYSELSGNPIDLQSLRYYSVRAMLNTPLGLFPVIHSDYPRGDVPENLSWYVLFARAMVECLAEAIGIELEEPYIPDPVITGRSPIFDVVIDSLREGQLPRIDDSYRAYRMHSIIRLLEYLRLSEKLSPALDAEELDDLGSVLGNRPANMAEGDHNLQQLVIESGPERDGELVRYFYRRLKRQEAMLRPAMGEMAVTGTLSPIH
ncbi:MAG: phosphotransferase [Dehalococcoidia bacterium]